MGTLVNTLLIGLYTQSLSQVSPVDPVVLSLEHELEELPVVVDIKCGVENSDHLWVVVATIL